MPAPALLMAAEIGFFHVAFSFGQPVIAATIWLALLISCGLQYLLLHRLPKFRLFFPALALIALTVCEVCCAMTSGWDIFIWVFAAGYCFIAFLGTALAELIFKFTHKQKSVS